MSIVRLVIVITADIDLPQRTISFYNCMAMGIKKTVSKKNESPSGFYWNIKMLPLAPAVCWNRCVTRRT